MGLLATISLFVLSFPLILCIRILAAAQGLVAQCCWSTSRSWRRLWTSSTTLGWRGDVRNFGFSEQGQHSYINVHIEPGAHYNLKKHIAQQVASRCLDPEDGLSTVGGDWNFMASGENRYNIQQQFECVKKEPLAKLFDTLCAGLVEFEQPDPTRAQLDGDGVAAAVSRLDRVYSNLVPMDILDFRPTAIATHNIVSRGRLSDHSPVSVKFAGLRDPRHEVSSSYGHVPPWVCKDPMFEE